MILICHHGPNHRHYSSICIDGRDRSKKGGEFGGNHEGWRVQGGESKRTRRAHEIRRRGRCMRQEVGDHLLSLWLDFPWAAGGRLQVDAFFFFSSALSLHRPSPCRTSPCYHGNTGRAEPWDREMQTVERSTLPFPQSTGRRAPPPTHTRKWIRDLIAQWRLIPYFICILSEKYFMCKCESTKVSPHAKWTPVSLTFMWFLWYLLCTIFICFQTKKLISAIKPKKKVANQKLFWFATGNRVQVCREI